MNQICCKMYFRTPDMARKRKRKATKFDVVSAVKAAARAAVGTPPPTRKESAGPKRRKQGEKHKPTLGKLLDETE